MAIKFEQGVTTLTPTAWKWFVGGAVIFFLIPPFGALIALVFVLTGAGVLQRVSLSTDGLTVRNWFSTRTYAWHEIDDFRIRKVKSGLITAANMVSFTHADKQGTMMGKAAKLLAGGTHSIPAVGVTPQKLVQLMQAYKGGFAPKEAAPSVASVPESPPQPRAIPAPKAPTKSRPRAVPATPRAARAQSKSSVNLGGSRKTASPLVQDGGGLFGRRRPDSPFKS